MSEKKTGFDRRAFLRRAAAAGAVVWAVPIIESVAAQPAFAGTPTTCDWSGCKGACAGSSVRGKCPDGTNPGQFCGTPHSSPTDPCNALCTGPGQPCTTALACDPTHWSFCTFTA